MVIHLQLSMAALIEYLQHLTRLVTTDVGLAGFSRTGATR